MLLIVSVFYFFAYSNAKDERVTIFKEKSQNLVRNFKNMTGYYMTIVKKYAPSKEFVFLLNENFFVKNLSVNSSKDLIKQIKDSEKNIENIFIFDSEYKEVFSQKIPIDIKELLKHQMFMKNGSLFVYSPINGKRGLLVFEIKLDQLKKDLDGDLLQYYFINQDGKVILSSDGFKLDLYTKFSKKSKLFDTDELIYYFSPIGEYMLGTTVEKNILFKRINSVFLVILFWILLISLLSIVQSIRASNMITSPIDKLTKLLGKNRDGEYSKIELKGDDEVEYFVAQYNEMIDRITEFTNELEDKVEQRTKKIQNQKEELKLLSQTDTLTGVYNRNKLNEIVIARQKYDAIYSIIIMDIDDFKIINDKYGHNVGDVVLKEFATVLKKSTRKSDFLGRWGGEEFIIICSDIDKEKTLEISEKIRKKIEDFNFYKNLKVTASFGVAEYTKGISYDELFVLADSALYKAKKNGKNRVVAS